MVELQIKETGRRKREAPIPSPDRGDIVNASALRGLQLLSPSIIKFAMATKAAMQPEVLEIPDCALVKRKKGCLEDIRRLEEAPQLQSEIFCRTFSIGADALRWHKEAAATLASARGRNESPAVIQGLLGAKERSEGDLKRVTNWCAVAKFGMQTLEKKLEEIVDEVTALDIEIAMLDGAGDALGTTNTCLANLDKVMNFLA
jgi:hypothetical protein